MLKKPKLPPAILGLIVLQLSLNLAELLGFQEGSSSAAPGPLQTSSELLGLRPPCGGDAPSQNLPLPRWLLCCWQLWQRFFRSLGLNNLPEPLCPPPASCLCGGSRGEQGHECHSRDFKPAAFPRDLLPYYTSTPSILFANPRKLSKRRLDSGPKAAESLQQQGDAAAPGCFTTSEVSLLPDQNPTELAAASCPRRFEPPYRTICLFPSYQDTSSDTWRRKGPPGLHPAAGAVTCTFGLSLTRPLHPLTPKGAEGCSTDQLLRGTAGTL